MALTSSMFVGSEGTERGTEVRRTAGLRLFAQERLVISIVEEDTLRGDLPPQLRGLTHVGCAEGGGHRGQGSARDAPPTPYQYLDPGASAAAPCPDPPPKVGTSPRNQPSTGVTPCSKGTLPRACWQPEPIAGTGAWGTMTHRPPGWDLGQSSAERSESGHLSRLPRTTTSSVRRARGAPTALPALALSCRTILSRQLKATGHSQHQQGHRQAQQQCWRKITVSTYHPAEGDLA